MELIQILTKRVATPRGSGRPGKHRNGRWVQAPLLALGGREPEAPRAGSTTPRRRARAPPPPPGQRSADGAEPRAAPAAGAPSSPCPGPAAAGSPGAAADQLSPAGPRLPRAAPAPRNAGPGPGGRRGRARRGAPGWGPGLPSRRPLSPGSALRDEPPGYSPAADEGFRGMGPLAWPLLPERPLPRRDRRGDRPSRSEGRWAGSARAGVSSSGLPVAQGPQGKARSRRLPAPRAPAAGPRPACPPPPGRPRRPGLRGRPRRSGRAPPHRSSPLRRGRTREQHVCPGPGCPPGRGPRRAPARGVHRCQAREWSPPRPGAAAAAPGEVARKPRSSATRRFAQRRCPRRPRVGRDPAPGESGRPPRRGVRGPPPAPGPRSPARPRRPGLRRARPGRRLLAVRARLRARVSAGAAAARAAPGLPTDGLPRPGRCPTGQQAADVDGARPEVSEPSPPREQPGRDQGISPANLVLWGPFE
ncbi:basic salivary proline-rich protein 1-like [Lepus europaeus]|uniref:basic salivary proline-rich protein 1-like n=1 Tax=Lepus europaeus TaxID=9983 RepID=UPI002B48C40F|nr:basic salivary proline-rich protein 1-like [Lepus europaeus]